MWPVNRGKFSFTRNMILPDISSLPKVGDTKFIQREPCGAKITPLPIGRLLRSCQRVHVGCLGGSSMKVGPGHVKKVVAMFSMDCDYWKTSVVSGLPRAINITTMLGTYVPVPHDHYWLRPVMLVLVQADEGFPSLVQPRLLAWPGLNKVYFRLRRLDVTRQG